MLGSTSLAMPNSMTPSRLPMTASSSTAPAAAVSVADLDAAERVATS